MAPCARWRSSWWRRWWWPVGRLRLPSPRRRSAPRGRRRRDGSADAAPDGDRHRLGGPIAGGRVQGSATVINVWATWCAPCRQEQPAILATLARYADQACGSWGSTTRTIANWRAVVDEYDVPYPSLFDPHGQTAALLGFPYLPDTYVVDAAGTIRWRSTARPTKQELSGLIDEVLAGDAAARRARRRDERVDRDGAEQRGEVHDRVLEQPPGRVGVRTAPQHERPVDEHPAQPDRGREVDRAHVGDRLQQQRRRRTAPASRGRSGAGSRARP